MHCKYFLGTSNLPGGQESWAETWNKQKGTLGIELLEQLQQGKKSTTECQCLK